MEHGPTDAAGIQLDTIAQPPGFVPWRGPVLGLGPIAQLANMVLPVAQGTVVGVVDFHQVEQRLRPLPSQPVIELVAEGAELRVFAIAQGQDGVAQRVQRECLRHHVADEAERGVGRIAFAGGADDEHGARDSLQPRRIQPFQPRALDRNAAVAQRRGGHVGQLHRETGLTGMHHPRRIRSGQHHRLFRRVVLARAGQHARHQSGIRQQGGGGDEDAGPGRAGLPPVALVQAGEQPGARGQRQHHQRIANQGGTPVPR